MAPGSEPVVLRLKLRRRKFRPGAASNGPYENKEWPWSVALLRVISPLSDLSLCTMLSDNSSDAGSDTGDVTLPPDQSPTTRAQREPCTVFEQPRSCVLHLCERTILFHAGRCTDPEADRAHISIPDAITSRLPCERCLFYTMRFDAKSFPEP